MLTRTLLSLIFTCLSLATLSSAQPPYPIIFVHGLNSNDTEFEVTMRYLGGYLSPLDWGGMVNVFDILLTADNNNGTAVLAEDVAWEDFASVNLGRRLWSVSLGHDDPGGYIHEWIEGSSLFAVNFQEERIEGTNGQYVGSNEAAIYKQGYALKKMVQEVLSFTGAEKVILVGHSMGGLAIREYLQREVGNERVWWQNQTTEGHSVAKVVTLGTPHLGSNVGNVLLSDGLPNPNSEAARDMRYEYGTWSSSPPNFETDNGVYLFGGMESWLEENFGFHNYDVDCDGDHLDYIIGLNDPYANGLANPLMLLPGNVDYVWIASDNGGFGDGDGVVRFDRQYLYNVGSVITMNRDHGDEPDDYATIIRALDEPATSNLAYEIDKDASVDGFITIQSGGSTSDTDLSRFVVSQYSTQTFNVTGDQSGVSEIQLLDGGLIPLSWDESAPFEIVQNLVPGTYYLKVSGTATEDSWQSHYTLNGGNLNILLWADFTATPTSGTIPLVVNFTDLSEGQITSWEWDFDDDGDVDSYEQNPQHEFAAAGAYTISLTVSDGVWYHSETKYGYIVAQRIVQIHPDSVWSRTYGDLWTRCEEVQQTADGGYILIGWGSSTNPFATWIIKTDDAGMVEWDRTIMGGPATNGGHRSIRQCSDYGYVFAGHYYSGTLTAGFHFSKINVDGDSVWSRTFRVARADYCRALELTTDQGFVLAGTTDAGEMCLLKTNANGDSLWYHAYGQGLCWSVIEASDGGFALCGTVSTGNGNADYRVVKTNANGDSLWSRTLGGEGYEECFTVVQMSDGGFALTGSTSSFGIHSPDYPNSANFWLVKLSATGDSLWSRTYGGMSHEECKAMVATDDGGLILGGSTYASGEEDMWLVKTSEDGDVEWTESYGGSGAEECYSVQQTMGGGYIAAGYTGSFSDDVEDFWLVKLGEDSSFCTNLTPTSPEVVVQRSGNNALLSWNRITQSIAGCPITIESYDIYSSPTVDGVFQFLDSTPDTSYSHSAAISNDSTRFYYVRPIRQ